MVTVEAKANTDWSFREDILNEIERVEDIQCNHRIDHLAHCLIVAESKWSAVKNPRARQRKSSQWNRLREWYETREECLPIFILTWEAIAESIRSLGTSEAKGFHHWLVEQVKICLLPVEKMPPAS